MGIKIAKALGCEVTAISTTASKEAKCKEIGASNFLLFSDAEQVKAAAGSLDLVLDTISAEHEITQYTSLLHNTGKYVVIGGTSGTSLATFALLMTQKSLHGSLIGGTRSTQEMMDFCCEKNVFPQVEVIPASDIAKVLKHLTEKNDQVIRYVIDCSTIPKAS